MPLTCKDLLDHAQLFLFQILLLCFLYGILKQAHIEVCYWRTFDFQGEKSQEKRLGICQYIAHSENRFENKSLKSEIVGKVFS